MSVSGEKVVESRSGMIHELRAALADLTEEGRTYLGRLAGEQTVLSVHKVREGNNGVSTVQQCEDGYCAKCEFACVVICVNGK